MHIVVSGVTGAGKTTWAAALASYSRAIHASESHDSNPFFGSLERENRGVITVSQLHFLMSAGAHHYRARLANVDTVQDHSLYEVAEIYTRERYLHGLIDKESYGALNHLYMVMKAIMPPPDVVLLVSAAPSVVRRRVLDRGRPFDTVPSEENLITSDGGRRALWSSMGCPVVELDNTPHLLPIAADPRVALLWQELKRRARGDRDAR